VLLVGPDGKVKDVWSFAEPKFTPAWPEGAGVFTDAIKQWEYAPAPAERRTAAGLPHGDR
jgi:hypothetical protein